MLWPRRVASRTTLTVSGMRSTTADMSKSACTTESAASPKSTSETPPGHIAAAEIASPLETVAASAEATVDELLELSAEDLQELMKDELHLPVMLRSRAKKEWQARRDGPAAR